MPEPTIKDLEKRHDETITKIDAALQDIKADKASTSEVLALIDERKTADAELAAKITTEHEQTKSAVDELKVLGDEMNKKIRQLKSSAAEESRSDCGYVGHFSSPQRAKTFALLVLAGITGGEPKLKDRYDRVKKSLDDMGVEPYFVDEHGRKTMTGTSQTGGGVLVTVEQSPEIIKLLTTYGNFRANARPWPMGAGATLVPKVDGLLTVYCPGEGGTITQTDPTLKLISMTPKGLMALTGFSLDLEDDSLVALGELLADLFARSFAYYEDLCGFLGDGTSTYFGFKGIVGALMAVSATIANIKSLVVGAGNTYAELTLANFNSVSGTLPKDFDNEDTKWYVHKYFYHTVMVALALAAGGATATEVILGAGQKRRIFLGDNVEFASVMPRAEANSQICALLANLRMGAILGTRGGMEFATSDQRYFDSGVIAVRGRDRVAINVHGVGDTTNAGPICGLITAAS
jgi:HK97 family phage major capsid protein